MGWTFAALLVGGLVGIANVLPERYMAWTSRLTTAALALLLFAMGLRIGSDEAILASLRTLGYQAVVLATATSLGSVVVVWMVSSSGLLRLSAPGRAAAGGAQGEGGYPSAAAVLPVGSGGSRLSMTILIVASVTVGIALGGLGLLPAAYAPALSPIAEAALGVILFGVGMEVAHNRRAWQELRRLGVRALLLPAGVVVGTLAGAALAGPLVRLPVNEATAIGAGFGWYSLSGVLLAEIYNVSTGTLAFLTNVLRELIAVVAMPLLATRLDHAAAIAPGGATTMDTTLPIIARSMGAEAALLAFASGATLTALVPILVPLLIRM